MVDEAIKKFELPRKDWYDVVEENPIGQIVGRIYKDALIENFNAIESKLIDITELDALDIQLPDFSTINYPDVTLASDDNCIVNLKSFLDICNIYDYPFDISFNGTKCSLSYFHKTDNGSIILRTVVNQETNADDTNKFIYLDVNNNTLIANDAIKVEDKYIFIGVYSNSRVFSNESPKIMDKED